jgi:MerR family mercuric resistance operon transcriptional regulator
LDHPTRANWKALKIKADGILARDRFTLEGISGLLGLDERKACLETREAASQKLMLIEKKISDLLRMKKALSRLVLAGDGSSASEPCPIIHLLIQD